MKKQNFKKLLLTTASIACFASSSALAVEVTGAGYGSATNITDSFTDITNENNGDFGIVDANGGGVSSPLSFIGAIDGVQNTTTISVIDSVGGTDTWIVGDLSINQDGANTDAIVFELGSSDGGTSDLLSTGITFTGAVDAGANGSVSIATQDATNADFVLFQASNVNLGSGAITLNNANDQIVFSGASAQTFTGDIVGSSAGILNNDASVTLNGTVSGLSDIQIANATVTDAAGGNISSAAITLQGATSTLRTTSAATITGAINGGGIFDVDEDTTINGLVGNVSALDSITIAAGKTLTTGALATGIDAGTITLQGAGATLDTANATTITADIEGDGSGNGNFDVNEDATLIGNVGLANEIAGINIASTKTLTLDADAASGNIAVNAGAIDLQGTGTLNVNARNSGGSVTFGAPITAAATGNGTITINDTDDATNSIVTFSQDIGTSASHVGLLEIKPTYDGSTGVNANTVNVAGNAYVDSITIEGVDGALNFTGNGASVSGTIAGDGGADYMGRVFVTSGADVTFEDTIDVNTFDVQGTANISNYITLIGFDARDGGEPDVQPVFNVASNGELNIDTSGGNVSISVESNRADFGGTMNIDGSVNSSGSGRAIFSAEGLDFTVDGAINSSSRLTLYSDRALEVGTNSDTTFDMQEKTWMSGDALGITIGASGRSNNFIFSKTDDFDGLDIIDASSQNVVIAGDFAFTIGANSQLYDHGDEIYLLEASGGSIDRSAANIDFVYAGDSVMSTFTEGASTSQEIVGVFSYLDGASAFGAGTRGVGASDTILQDTTQAELTAAGGALNSARANLAGATTFTRAQYLAESLAPIVNRGEIDTATEIADQSYDLSSSRIAALRSMNLEEVELSRTLWGHLFGSDRTQDERKGIQGYDANTFGFTFGADMAFNDGATIAGLAFTYANTDVDSKAGVKSRNDIDTCQATLYGQHDFANLAYISGQASYAFSQNSTKRYDVGGSGAVAKGDYDANTFGAKLELGKVYPTESFGGVTLTPSVLANYLHYSADSYTETGANSANLNVDYDSANVFEIGAEIDAGWSFAQKNGASVSPAMHFGVRQDLIGDAVSTTSSFIGAGPAFNTDGADTADTTLNAGFDVTYRASDALEVSVSYDYDYKSDYDAHAGIVRVSYKF